MRQERTSEERRGRLQEGINKLDAAVHQIGHQLSITVEEHRKNVSAATVKYEEISQRINDSKPLFQCTIVCHILWLSIRVLDLVGPRAT